MNHSYHRTIALHIMGKALRIHAELYVWRKNNHSSMAMVSASTLLLVLAASFSPVSSLAVRRHDPGYLVVATSSLKPNVSCTRLSVMPSSRRIWLPLHHRHGPCSSSQSSTTRSSSSTADMLRSDQLRAAGIIRHGASAAGGPPIQPPSSSSDDGSVTLPTALGTRLHTLEYVVTVGLGTPAAAQTLLIDTGSGLPYVQCRPCRVPPCHRQKDAFFDPRKSSTYTAFSCGSAACARLGANRANSSSCSSGSRCEYVIRYGDGSNTTGTYGSDTLTLASGGGGVVRNFRFGCSRSNEGADRTDGIMGLSRGAQSLVSQTGKKAFSYCLPPSASGTGFLTLGAPRMYNKFTVTPMYKFSEYPTFYTVLLKAITVAGRRLAVPPSAFAAGAIVDSGTIVTRLPPTAYRALRAAFRREMKAYPRAPARSNLDTCFNLSGVSHVKVPRVALEFDRGAVVELHPAGIMQYDCLAFTSTGGDDDNAAVGFIGNVQQRTFEVLYDVGRRVVGFRRGAC